MTLVSEAACGSDSVSQEERFLKEYPEAAKDIEEFYTHIRLTGTRRKTGRKGDVTHEMDFAAKGALFRLYCVEREGFPLQRVGATRVYLRTKKHGARALHRYLWEEKFVHVPLCGPDHELDEAMRDGLMPAYAPYCVHRRRIVDLIAEPEIKITNAVEFDGNVKVAWVCGEDNDERQSGWFTVAPNMCWVLRESETVYEVEEKDVRDIRRAKVDYYSAEGTRVPIVKNVEHWTEYGPNRKVVGFTTYEDLAIKPALVPLEEFTLESFGITDVPAKEPAGNAENGVSK